MQSTCQGDGDFCLRSGWLLFGWVLNDKIVQVRHLNVLRQLIVTLQTLWHIASVLKIAVYSLYLYEGARLDLFQQFDVQRTGRLVHLCQGGNVYGLKSIHLRFTHWMWVPWLHHFGETGSKYASMVSGNLLLWVDSLYIGFLCLVWSSKLLIQWNLSALEFYSNESMKLKINIQLNCL